MGTQTFVKNRKVEERKVLVQQNGQLSHPLRSPAAASAARELQRPICSGRCCRTRGSCLGGRMHLRSRAAPRSAGLAGRMRGVGKSIAMATVTSIHPGSNWRKPRGRSRSLRANRTYPSRPTLRAFASLPAPPPGPPFRALASHWPSEKLEVGLPGEVQCSIGRWRARPLRARLRREGPRLKPKADQSGGTRVAAAETRR